MMKESKKRALTERLKRNLSDLTLVVVFLFAVIGVGIGIRLSTRNPLRAGLLFGVSSSLIAYVMTVGIHARVSDIAHRELLEEVLRAQVREVLQEVQEAEFSSFAKQFPKLLPSGYFSATNISSPDFERELAKSMAESSRYYFRGVTGRHVPIFLERTRPSHLHATVMVLHPEESQLLRLYAMDRFGEATMTAEERAEIVDEVRRETYYAIVGLFDVASICPISLRLHRGPVYYRSEIFDDRCFVAYYVGQRKTYAVTYAYDSGTLFYDAFYKDVFHLVQSSEPAIELTADTLEEDLLDFLRSIGCTYSIKTLRREFLGFKERFNASAK